MSCNPNCLICETSLNTNCAECVAGTYMDPYGACADSCPENYIEDDTYKICSIDTSLLLQPEKPKDPQGCMDGTYWNWDDGNCDTCNSQCNTCEFSSTRCTSCPIGSFLNDDYTCSTCLAFFTTVMMVGTDGTCIETCGDGENYGLL
jgi:proprotein convertase subtilisin/kexin type 5